MFSSLTNLPRFAKALLLACVDGVLAIAALWVAVLARVGGIPEVAPNHVLAASTLVMVFVPVVAFASGLYRPVIRFHIPQLSLHVAVLGLLCGMTIAAIGRIGGAPFAKALGLGAVFALVLFALLLLSRHAARWLLYRKPSGEVMRVAIYGAGAAGRQLVALMREANQYKPVIFIDDNQALHGRVVESVPVIGSADRKFAQRLAARKIDEIFLAVPSLKPSRRREILERLGELPYRVRSVPGIAELAKGEPHALADLRDISVEELLGRDPVQPLPGLLERCVKDSVVLITGGGGSIGSELCRQVLALAPSRLIVLDHSELALYQVEMELRRLHSEAASRCELVFILGSITDRRLLAGIFAEHCIDTVYHAAAYKHVPIVEENALEGLRNNALGTWYVAEAAAQAGARHFILISSDKAVRPTNVMGATKRMAELVVQMLAEQARSTVFSMVRFGNVLGSSGSVVPLFRAQIERGGPVTLTHPDVTRYFMTIEEAVQLVIQAGAMARGGEVFVLDMGKPVRIKDLAMRMIRFAGRSLRDAENPHGDVAIDIVGLRVGEKLYEELLISGEGVHTAHPRIWQVRESGADASSFAQQLSLLERHFAEDGAALDVRDVLKRWVAGYVTQDLPRPMPRAFDRPAASVDQPAELLNAAR